MEERSEFEPDADLDLTPEERVAADEAMLLDLGSAEQLADLIAEQSVREPRRTPSASEAAAEASSVPQGGADDTSPQAD